jgi:protein SCO1/2
LFCEIARPADKKPVETPNPFLQLILNLKTEKGQPLTTAEFGGTDFYLTFSYTRCRKTCPMTTFKRLREIQDELSSGAQAEGASHDKPSSLLPVLIVTLDPAEDTPAALAKFRKEHKIVFSNWHFLTGAPATVHDLAKLIGFDYWTMDDHIFHDYKIVRVSPAGVFKDVSE